MLIFRLDVLYLHYLPQFVIRFVFVFVPLQVRVEKGIFAGTSWQSRIAEKENIHMRQASWFTRLGPLVSILGAVLTGISLFLPLILTQPPVAPGFTDPFPPTLNGVSLLSSLFTPQSQISSLGTFLFALLIVLALVTLATSIAALIQRTNVSGVVSWIRGFAAISGVAVALWFVEVVELLNYHVGFGTGAVSSPRFDIGFGLAFVVIGTALSALGVGLLGVGAVVGIAIGYLLLFILTSFALLAFPIGVITCILGTLVGWWIQRATAKSTSVASS